MPKMIKKKNTPKEESTVEAAQRESLIKAAQTIQGYCTSRGTEEGCCEGCPFHNKNRCCSLYQNHPDSWKLPTLTPSRADMEKYILDHCFIRTFKNGRTTAAIYNGNLYVVTRYYKDKDDELVARYELYKKIFG